MANRDNLRGFWPIRHLTGGQIRAREMVATTGATIYRGDLLKIVDAGTVEAATTDDGVIVIGVAVEYVSDSGSVGGKKVLVYADPYIVFGVQSDSGTATTAADIGETANHEDATGNTSTLMSKHELDASDIGTGGQLKIIGLINEPANAYGEHSNLEVIIAEHFFNAAVAGV